MVEKLTEENPVFVAALSRVLLLTLEKEVLVAKSDRRFTKEAVDHCLENSWVYSLYHSQFDAPGLSLTSLGRRAAG